MRDEASGKTYYYNASTVSVPAYEWLLALTAPPWSPLKRTTLSLYFMWTQRYICLLPQGVTQWDPPPGFGAADAGSKGGAGAAAAGGVAGGNDAAKKDVGDRKAMLARRSQIAKRSTAKPATVGEKLAARAKKFVALRKAEKAKSQPSACEWGRGTLKAVVVFYL